MQDAPTTLAKCALSLAPVSNFQKLIDGDIL